MTTLDAIADRIADATPNSPTPLFPSSPTPSVVPVSWGVSINACIRRTGCLGADPTAQNAARNATAASTHAASMHALREIGGGR